MLFRSIEKEISDVRIDEEALVKDILMSVVNLQKNHTVFQCGIPQREKFNPAVICRAKLFQVACTSPVQEMCIRDRRLLRKWKVRCS